MDQYPYMAFSYPVSESVYISLNFKHLFSQAENSEQHCHEWRSLS